MKIKYKNLQFGLLFFGVLIIFSLYDSQAYGDNENLFVSAENTVFDNHFAGTMVVEVIINDSSIKDTDEGKGEPDVTINGKDLRMVQGTDGSWYGYFANVRKAKTADQIVADNGAGAVGKSLDFGVFCSRDTAKSVLGVSFSDTEGIAIPRSGGIAGFTNGESSFTACTGAPTNTAILNNVVKSPKTINTNSAIPAGQIGLNQNAWPIIQLFSFNDVIIQYNKAGGAQTVELQYDEIPHISATLDREIFPANSEVFLTINDIQLNQDPTSRDSWTFKVTSPQALFYQAFTESGATSATGSTGLINLIPRLSNLGFEKNGMVEITSGEVLEFQTNNRQPGTTVTDGTTTFSNIITMVESEPNTGIFESFDASDKSTMKIKGDAPRGQTAVIEYNEKAASVLSGSSTASIALDAIGSLNPEQKTKIILTDYDQDTNTGAREDLEVFRSTALIPTLEIGTPVTLEKATMVKIHEKGTDSLTTTGTTVPVTFLDENSKRLFLDTKPPTFAGASTFEKISLNMGFNANELQSLLIDTSITNNDGTNWFNYDFRSLEKQLEVNDFSDTTITLFFGLTDATPVVIADAGDITKAKGLIQIDDTDITAIKAKTGAVFLVINFDSSDNTFGVGTISTETDTQPIVFDMFSFGLVNNQNINNAVYRFELKETTADSGIFTGTVEYTVANQLNVFSAGLIQTLQTIDDEIRFLANDRLVDEEGINIAYSDITQAGVTLNTSVKTDVKTHSGTVSTTAKSYRFGQPVTIVLEDSDLNLKQDLVDIYFVVNDAGSDNVDAVGTAGGDILLEVLIKDFRYKRCTIGGVEHGGLAATGFTLTETGPDTGRFEGVFKMPTEICNKDGTKMISTAGGSIDIKYYDFRDALGTANIITTKSSKPSMGYTAPYLNGDEFELPKYLQTKEVILNGKIHDYNRGTPVNLILTLPDGTIQTLDVFATNSGEYRATLTLTHEFELGAYFVEVNYRKQPVGQVFFEVVSDEIPEWIKNNARWWASDQISDNDFTRGIEHLMKAKIIDAPQVQPSSESTKQIPDWIKNTADWWADNAISDEEFTNALEYLVKQGIIRT